MNVVSMYAMDTKDKEIEMPFRVGPMELLLVLMIALLIFGPGRIAQLGGELGKSISAFQREIKKAELEVESDEESSTSDAA